MNRFKKWLIPVAVVCLLLASIVGCGNAPASLGETFDPSGNPFAHRFSDQKDIRTATFVVAASDSVHRYDVDYRCSGADDHVQIQAAIDALPATGGEVFLLDGIYYIEDDLVMDSYQTLRGCGRNTILTTSTSATNIVTATGGAGTEKVGLLIADLCIDGQAGPITNNDDGIRWIYVDDSKVANCWLLNNEEDGVQLTNCDRNKIEGNWLYNDDSYGVYLTTCCNNEITGNWVSTCYLGIYLETNSLYNTIQGNTVTLIDDAGIFCYNGSNHNTIVSNVAYACYVGIESYGCESNAIAGNTVRSNTWIGIFLTEDYHTSVTGNTTRDNTDYGIEVYSCLHCPVVGNTCVDEQWYAIDVDSSDYCIIADNTIFETARYGIYVTGSDNNIISGNLVDSSSQTTDNAYDNIFLNLSSDNLISGNKCRMGTLANQPRYGINISAGTCNRNVVQGNDLHSAGLTANFNDADTLTHVRDDNKGITPFQVRHLVYVQNTSGGLLLAGNIVSYEAAAGAIGFQTPTAIGDPQVWAMLPENLADNVYGYIQVKGGTTLMDATNVGGGNIVIGDLLCTEVGNRARKAAAGHTVFAIALEACAAANAIIDALIIGPRES